MINEKTCALSIMLNVIKSSFISFLDAAFEINSLKRSNSIKNKADPDRLDFASN